MPKNEDGEFELVLGNKQLLSMFFVVVVLLGVFFVMGYIVGRNSAPLLTAENTNKPEGKPLVVDSPAKQAPPVVENPPAAAPSEKPAEKAPEPAPAPVEKAPPPVAKTETPKAETAKKAEAKAEAKADAKASRPAAAAGQPAAGTTYLQLSATDKTDADKMVEELRKNGFQAIDAEVPEKAGLFRVLVGPISSGDMNKTRDELQSKSFNGKGAIPKKF